MEPQTSRNDEIFDVVNEHDECIGKELRAVVHRLGLRHRAVHILVFNSRGELFLQKRSMTKDCFPGTWDSSASGHLDCGESYDACAVRELREELNLTDPVQLEPLFKIDACPQTGQEFVWIYRCHHEGPFQLQAEEISEGAWFSIETIHRWVVDRPAEFAGAFPLIWERLGLAKI